MKKTILLVILTALCGCSTPKNSGLLNQLNLGMTKPEVLKVLGQPDSIRAEQGGEFLVYQWEAYDKSGKFDYLVHLQNGFVDKYGKKADFDNAGTITNKKIITIQKDSSQ